MIAQIHFHEIDLTTLVVALGTAIPAIIAAINSIRNSRHLKKNFDCLDRNTQVTERIEKKINGGTTSDPH